MGEPTQFKPFSPAPNPLDGLKNQSVTDDSYQKAKHLSEADFLAKVTSFVAKYEPKDEYAEKIWPAVPPKEPSSQECIPTNTSKTSGKKYLDIEKGTEWFGRSIEMKESEPEPAKNKSQKTVEKSPKVVNNLSTGAALMRKHLSVTEPGLSPPGSVEDYSEDITLRNEPEKPFLKESSEPLKEKTSSTSTEKSLPVKDKGKLLHLSPEVPARTKSKSPRIDVADDNIISLNEPAALPPVAGKTDQILQPATQPATQSATQSATQPATQSANAEFYTKLVT